MISTYICNLVDSIPTSILKKEKLDIVLDGGLFNGSYLAGALLFIKELEYRKHCKVKRISGCSVGSIVAVLYHLNAIHLSENIYNILLDTIKKTDFLDAFSELFEVLNPLLTDEMCLSMNKRVYITYYNIVTGKRIIKYKYKNKSDIFNAIKRSCFVPFIINGNMVYQKKYIDGINPYIFPIRKDRKIIYMDLLGYGKLTHVISVKNETSNFHRILAGALDIHFYYLRNSSSLMSSCVNNWSLIEFIYYTKIRYFIERIIYYIFYIVFTIHSNLHINIIKSDMYKYIHSIIKQKYIYYLHQICL